MKENQTNRNLLIKLFGQEWIKKRDQFFKDIDDREKSKQGQLKLF